MHKTENGSLNQPGAFVGADLARQVSECFLMHGGKHNGAKNGDWQLGAVVVKTFQSCREQTQCRVFDGAVVPIHQENQSLARLALKGATYGNFILVEGDINFSSIKSSFSKAKAFMPLTLSMGESRNFANELSNFKRQLKEPSDFEDSVARHLQFHNVAVVMASGTIPFAIRHLCAQSYGILLLQNVALKDVETLSRVFSCPVLSDVLMLLPTAATTNDSLNNYVSHDSAQIEIIEDGWNIYGIISESAKSVDSMFVGIKVKDGPIKSCENLRLNQRPVTVMISSRTISLTAEIEKHFWSNLYRQRNAYKVGYIIPGKARTESYLAKTIIDSDAAKTNILRACFADALKYYASIINRNADLLGETSCDNDIYDDVIGKSSALARAVGLVEMMLRLI
mmetsp:Transcript_204/g.325  ORF Transcript_204/g.325 Transcript_204/m.325 type:complete len:396 (+) Transcript_204:56-1243(+)